MAKHIFYSAFLWCIVFFNPVKATVTDKLQQQSYDDLYEGIERHKGTPGALPYLNAYLQKAKKQDNPQELFNGYNYYIYEVEENQRLTYADSMLYAAERTDSNELIGSAILTRGAIHYSRKDYSRALDNFLIANRLISTTTNTYLQHKVRYSIGHIKYYLGFYNEAIALFKSCQAYYRERDSRAYLNCLHSLALCYTLVGSYSLSEEINRLAVSESKRLNDHSMLDYLYHAQGVNHYYRREYTQAIGKLTGSVPHLTAANDFGNLSVAYFYIGAGYWDTGKKDKALPYLLLVDRIFTEKKYIRPDLRQNYELLIDYYTQKEDRDSQLLYINRLLQADKLLHSNFRYLSGKIHKEYDTAELYRAKHRIEDELKREHYIKKALLAAGGILLPLSAYLIYRNSKLRKYKKNFESYRQKRPLDSLQNNAQPQKPNLPEELERDILQKLEEFEAAAGFIRKDIKTEKLAASFGTNSKYLSQVVNYHKGKSYPEYINDLRISYIVKKLEENPKIRQYHFQAIADECGFGTAQQFTGVFKKKMGMPLAYFLDQLNAQQQA